MHVIFAEAIGGMLVVVALMLAGLAASVLALFALRPAARGERSSTLKLIAPAAILGLVNLCVWVFGAVEIVSAGHSEMLLGYIRQWFMFIAAPLTTSLLSVIVLWRSRHKAT